MKPVQIVLIVFLGLILTACGSARVKPDGPKIERSDSATPPAQKGGGYYLDDGPGDRLPEDIDSIPDAVPRAETEREANSRPYTALGKQYVPMRRYQPYKERGTASWYGKRYHGNQTASGEPYDMYAMTGAHTTLPIPSYVRVTNIENGRSVVVRINDRGPFLNNRLIDLSYVAAHKLGIVQRGSGQVEVEWIDTRPESAAKAAPSQAAATGANSQLSGVYVQVGAFKSQENADRLRENLQDQNLARSENGENVGIQSWYNQGTYRVRLGPYTNRSEADKAAARINQNMGTSAIVVFQN
ncbi:Endolytic peptidoglycan transglycosylase RlpA [Methylophilaceae bacterium]|nr:Endolytic peptidoglycan transglycosylase RlpA [Methylophilaceae bacterium]